MTRLLFVAGRRPLPSCILLLASFAAASADATLPIVWVQSSLSRISQTATAGNSNQIGLYAAKNETYSFQIGIQAPAAGLTNVNVTTTGLVGPGGSTISGSDIALFRESYIYVPVTPPYYWYNSTDGTNPPNPPGWYPDGLIPFADPETGQPVRGGTMNPVPFSVSAGSNQPIWVDLHVPANTTSGTYEGQFSVTSDQGSASVQVTLTVWNFSLPETPSFKSSYQATQPHQDIYLAHELLRNRASPDWNSQPAEASLDQNWGLTSTNLWFSSGIGVWNCNTTSMPPAPSTSQFAAAAAQHGADLLIYNFSADEIGRCPQIFPTLITWAANMHAAGVKNLVTVEPVPALLDDGTGTGRSAVDIWTVLPEEYDDAQANGGLISSVLAKGDSVWSYNVLVQDGYSPKLEINFSPLDYRLSMGYISQSLGVSGFQQWLVDQWTSDPWNQMTVSPGGVPSDGLLVYPGAPVGIVGYAPSMRLKWIRDGTNDFEYVQILKGLGQGAWALQQAAAVGHDWRNWTRDYTQVETTRISLGNRIEQLMNPTISVGPLAPTIRLGHTQQFTVSTSGLANPGVIWTVNGVPGGTSDLGTISTSGLYTPPSVVPATTVTIQAASVTNQNVAGAQIVVLWNPVPVISPTAPATINTGAFQLAVNGTGFVTGLAATLDGVPINTTVISATQLILSGITAAVGGTYANLTLTNPNPGSASTSFTLAVQAPISVSITPSANSITAGTTQLFSAQVLNSSNQGVIWTVNGIQGGNAEVGVIAANGKGSALYTAPSSLSNPITVNVVAQTVQYPFVLSANSVLTVIPPVLYVTDTSGFIASIGSMGMVSKIASGLGSLSGVAIDSQNTLYVVNRANNLIAKVAADGTVSSFVRGGMNGPAGLAIDRDDNVYVAATSNSILRITPAGAVSSFVTVGLACPTGLAFDETGNLFATNYCNDTIVKVGPGGSVTQFVSGIHRPSGIAFDNADNLYVTSTADGLILKITPAGAVSTFASGFKNPNGLAFDATGNLYVADTGHWSVIKLDVMGNKSTVTNAGLNGPFFLAFGNRK